MTRRSDTDSLTAKSAVLRSSALSTPNRPLIVIEAVWQYSQQILPGLLGYCGPILTVANWSGQWPGLVGLLNLNASLAKSGESPLARCGAVDFTDRFFVDGLKLWLEGKPIIHDQSHVRTWSEVSVPAGGTAVGRRAWRNPAARQGHSRRVR